MTVSGVPLGLSDSRRSVRGRGSTDPATGQPAPVDPGASGSIERWQRLLRLRRGLQPLEPWLAALESGALEAEPDLIAALGARLDRPSVERLLAPSIGLTPQRLLQALGAELPALAADGTIRQAWLDPLLSRAMAAPPGEAVVWLQLIGQFRDGRVAHLLRSAITSPPEPDPAQAALLPLLGLQRQRQDGSLLLRLALDPGPSAWRRAALEGLAVGLSAWPEAELAEGLQHLAADLDPTLAAKAVDLLARLEDGQRWLRVLRQRPLDPRVAERLRRRLRLAPLVLVVHGRRGGVIPAVLQRLATELEARRGAPVLLQALTAEPPPTDRRFELAACRAGGITLVPLLLLPGGHVRGDLPALAAAWRERAGRMAPTGAQPPPVRRRPFLGAWPGWQRLLAEQLDAAAGARTLAWLHHPLQGPLSERFLAHLAGVFGRRGAAVAYQAEPETLAALSDAASVLAPLTLAPNRLSESLSMVGPAPAVEVLPPLLDLPAVREFLLASLEALP